MTATKRGDVVLVYFPFSDQNQLKLRPALVVQSDAVASTIDVVVACITSNTTRTGPTRVLLRLLDGGAQHAKLKTDSVVLAEKLATVPRSAIKTTTGVFPRMDLVDAALRIALAL